MPYFDPQVMRWIVLTIALIAFVRIVAATVFGIEVTT